MTFLIRSLPGILTLFLLSSLQVMAHSAIDTEELLQKGENHFKELENRAALDAFLGVLEVDSTNYHALHRTSLLYNLIGHQFEDEDDRMEHYGKAKRYAESALAHHEGKPEAHYVYSIAIGRIADKQAPRTRVGYASEIKSHAEKVLELNPDHAGAWHVLGVWHHQASTLSFGERTAVRMLGGLPPASKKEAEEAFEKAVELDRSNILFHLDYAKFHKDVGNKDRAIEMLEKAVALQPQVDGDEKFLETSKDMLASLK